MQGCVFFFRVKTGLLAKGFPQIIDTHAISQKHLHANGEGEESCQPALAFILLIVAIPEQGWFLSTYFRTVHFAYQASAQECAKSTIRTSWMRMNRNPPIIPKYIHTWKKGNWNTKQN